MATPAIKCQKCDGSGKVGLSDELREVVSLLKKHKGGLTAQLIANQYLHAYMLTPNAFNNRLEKLRAAGLVQRRRKGKTFVYTAI